jgi:hypothetical protein
MLILDKQRAVERIVALTADVPGLATVMPPDGARRRVASYQPREPVVRPLQRTPSRGRARRGAAAPSLIY